MLEALLEERKENGRKIVEEMLRKFPAGTEMEVLAGRGKAKVKVVGHGVPGGGPHRLVVEHQSTKRVTSVDGLNPGLQRLEA